MDKRVASSQRLLKAAKIEFGGRVIDCSIRNISANGACLEVQTPVGIPNDLR
jgi:hypothetical protein